MTIVNVLKNNTSYKEVVISGHSGYDISSRDIVCSSISTALYVSLGILERTHQKYIFTSDEAIPMMKITITEVTSMTDDIIGNMLDILTSIENDYAQYLKIKIK